MYYSLYLLSSGDDDAAIYIDYVLQLCEAPEAHYSNLVVAD